MEAGFSQKEAAERLGLAQGHWSRWESHREPDLDTIEAIERALELPHGLLILRAGYVTGSDRPEDIIERDPRLSDYERRVVLDFYRAALRRSRETAS